MMIPQVLRRSLVPVIAAALIMADASILRGQRDPDELTFQPPVNAAAGKANASARTTNPPSSTRESRPPALPTAGRAVVNKRVYNLPGRTLPAQTQSNDPKKNPPNSQLPYTPRSSIVTAGVKDAAATGSEIRQASHQDPYSGVTPDGLDRSFVPPRGRQAHQLPPQIVVSHSDQTRPSPVRGSIVGLNGETAMERLLQALEVIRELEQDNGTLRQQNATLQARVKEMQDQLATGVREIQGARKELTQSLSDLNRLKADIQMLREKVRTTENDHKAVLQSMGPLLQQLLEADDITSLPPNPTE